MIGLEVVAPKGFGFVSFNVYSLEKGDTGYNNASIRGIEDCDKVKGEPTRLIVSTERDHNVNNYLSCTLTDAQGNITPWSSKIILKKMVPQELAIPTDFGSIS